MRRGKTRRRNASAPSSKPIQSSKSPSPIDGSEASPGVVDRKQITTQNEAVLTSKNYRLARELVSFHIPIFYFPYSNFEPWEKIDKIFASSP